MSTYEILRLVLECDEKEKNACLHFFGSRALFMGPASMDFSNFFFLN